MGTCLHHVLAMLSIDFFFFFCALQTVSDQDPKTVKILAASAVKCRPEIGPASGETKFRCQQITL